MLSQTKTWNVKTDEGNVAIALRVFFVFVVNCSSDGYVDSWLIWQLRGRILGRRTLYDIRPNHSRAELCRAGR